MQKHCLFVMIAMVVVACCHAQLAFTITNPIAVERKDDLVMLKRTDLEKSLEEKIGDRHVLLEWAGTAQPVQYIDEDGDSQWDKLVFLCSLQPNEAKPYTLLLQPAITASEKAIAARARVRSTILIANNSSAAATAFQAAGAGNQSGLSTGEGIAWENDKLAFQLSSNLPYTMDAFGKLVTTMAGDTTALSNLSGYHPLPSPRADSANAASLPGSGMLAIALQDSKGNDTLITLGGNAITKATFRQIANGPLYAAFQLHYQCKIKDKSMTVLQEYRIWGGQYFYETQTTVTGAPPGAQLVASVAYQDRDAADSMRVDKAIALYMYSTQPQNNEAVGKAVLLPQKNNARFFKAPKSKGNTTEYLMATQNIINGKPLTFRFYASWSKLDTQFASLFLFKQFLKNEALLFSEAPVIK